MIVVRLAPSIDASTRRSRAPRHESATLYIAWVMPFLQKLDENADEFVDARLTSTHSPRRTDALLCECFPWVIFGRGEKRSRRADASRGGETQTHTAPLRVVHRNAGSSVSFIASSRSCLCVSSGAAFSTAAGHV